MDQAWQWHTTLRKLTQVATAIFSVRSPQPRPNSNVYNAPPSLINLPSILTPFDATVFS